MFQERQEYRKSYNSTGQLYVAGEMLEFICHDVSVKGILIEIKPGDLLVGIDDFNALLQENNSAELYVKGLNMSGLADIAWAKLIDDKILLGLEFQDVVYNADKLWCKRKNYRSKKEFSGHIITDDKQLEFIGVNLSQDGMAIQLVHGEHSFITGSVLKLKLDDVDIKGVGKVLWVLPIDEQSSVMGLRYLSVD